MSFVDQDDVLAVLEAAFAAAFRQGIGYELPLPFPRIAFHDAMNATAPTVPTCATAWSCAISPSSPAPASSGYSRKP